MRRCALIAAALLLPVPGAEAQETPPDTFPVARLEPVIVEVFRTPAELRRVPFAVSSVVGSSLRDARAGMALDETLRTVPGVQVDNRYNYALGERISIRGFGARTQFGVRGIRVLVDGLPATFADGQSGLEAVDPASIERVEVVRGPASAAYGNASGGVIHFRTLAPPPEPIRQELRVVGGEHGLLRVDSRTAGQLRGAGYQLLASRLDYDGYREHSEFQTTRISALLHGRIGEGELRFNATFLDFAAQNPGSLSRVLLEEGRFRAFPNNVAQRTGKDGRQAQIGAFLHSPLGAVALEVAAHVQRREITNPIPNAIIDLARTAGAARLLLRGGSMGAASWTIGVDFDAQWDDRENHANVQGESGDLRLDQAERVLGVGSFAQLLVPLAERVSLMAGLRADRFDFRVSDNFISAADPDDSGTRRMNAVSPSAGIVWNAHPAADLYVNIATSFETPTTTELANRPDGAGGFNPELEPQKARSFELGARGAAGARLTYQLAIYRTRIRNALIPFQVPDVAGRDFFRNAGTARHQGAEAAVDVAPLPRVSASLGYTYTDAVFDDYTVGESIFDGNRVPGVAPHRWSGGLSYQRDGGLLIGIEANRVSSIPVNDANTDDSPAYSLLNGRIGHAGLRIGRAELAPFIGVTNILDREYNTSVTINAFGDRFFEPGPTRSLYLGATVRAGAR